MAVVKQGKPDEEIGKLWSQSLKLSFREREEKIINYYQPSRLEEGDSARMVSASIHLANGKMNIVCNQMYYNQSSNQDCPVCQRMRQMIRSCESGNIALILDFPGQPYLVQVLAFNLLMHGCEPSKIKLDAQRTISPCSMMTMMEEQTTTLGMMTMTWQRRYKLTTFTHKTFHLSRQIQFKNTTTILLKASF